MKRLIFTSLFALTIAIPAQAQKAAPDSQLCRMQLDLLLEGEKLTAEEQAVFEAQCSCLEEQEAGGGENSDSCAQDL